MSLKYRYNSFNEYAAKVATKFPAWHPFRANPNSNWRKLLSPIFGDMISGLNDALTVYSQDLFLATTDIDKPDTLYATALEEDSLAIFDNQLFNSDFSQNTVDGYLGWQIDTNSYIQYTNFRVNANQTLNLLVNTDLVTQVEVEGIRLDTGATVTYTFNIFTSTLEVQETYALEINSITVTGNIVNTKLMLWLGDSNKEWTRHPNDIIHWLDKLSPSFYSLKGDGRHLYEVQGFTDMFIRTPATYASVNSVPLASDTLLNSGRDFIDLKIEFHGNSYPAFIDIFNGAIRKIIDKSVEYNYDLHEMKANQLITKTDYYIDAIYLNNETIIALARINDALTSSSSNPSTSSSSPAYSDYYLLWISPDHPTPEDGILQIIKSVKIGAVPEFNGTLDLFTLGNDPTSLIVSNTNLSITTLYQIDLKYDYFLVDLDNGELVFRETYNNIIGLDNYQPSYVSYFNALDEHGLMRGLPRLKLEKNYDYKIRLLSYSNTFRTNSSFEGLSNGINIRLGYEIVPNVLTFPDNLHIAKIDDTIYISDPNITANETLTRDPNYQRVYLSQTPHVVNSITIDGILWPSTLYKVMAGSNEIIFSNYPDIADTAAVVVNYVPYSTVFNLGTSSIKDLYDSLIADDVVVESTFLVSDLQQWPAAHIMDMSETGVNIGLTYYPVRLTNLGLDKLSAFQDLSITKYELDDLQAKAIELTGLMHDNWNKTTLDFDRWDMVTNNQIGGGLLPAYNDGVFSWLESGGQLYGHIENPSGNITRQGFELDELQNGINTTLDEIEVHKDLLLIGFTNDYNPMVTTGFFYIKEMQFYLFANKQRLNIPIKKGYYVDIEAIRLANPVVEYTNYTGFTPFYDNDDLYVLVSELGTAQLTGVNMITNAPVSTPISGFEDSAINYYLFEPFKEGAPIIITDLGSSLQEVQFAAKSTGLIKLLKPGVVDTPLFIEYEPATSEDYSILDVDASFDRGYLYLELDGVYTDITTAATNFGLVNGAGKGICRVVYDPDEGLSNGIDLNPGPIIETSSLAVVANPSGPSTVVNPNLYYDLSVGWGHDWGLDFGN